MLHPVPDPDDLHEIQELNHLFLILLQAHATSGAACFGLPRPLVRRVRGSSSAVLQGMSAFPRALFALNLDCADQAGTQPNAATDDLGSMRHAFGLTALLSAWNMARRRCFQARMFLGLSAHEAHLLCTLPISEIQRLAPSPRLLECAFPHAERLWAALLHHAEDGLPPALHLIGLQPRTRAGEDKSPGFSAASRSMTA